MSPLQEAQQERCDAVVPDFQAMLDKLNRLDGAVVMMNRCELRRLLEYGLELQCKVDNGSLLVLNDKQQKDLV